MRKVFLLFHTRLILYVNMAEKDVLVAEIANNEFRVSKERKELDTQAGLGLKIKEPVFEPFAQSSKATSKLELDAAVQTLVIIPILDEQANSIGILKALNSDKSIFASPAIKELAARLDECISLLLHINKSLKVSLQDILESYEMLVAALDSVGEGVVVADSDGRVLVSNLNAKLLLGVSQAYSAECRVGELLQGNDHLIDAYEKVQRGEERVRALTNTELVTNKGRHEDVLAVNFKCMAVSATKGDTRNVLILIQPIPNS